MKKLVLKGNGTVGIGYSQKFPISKIYGYNIIEDNNLNEIRLPKEIIELLKKSEYYTPRQFNVFNIKKRKIKWK